MTEILENASQHIACDFSVSQELWNVPSRVHSIATCGWALRGGGGGCLSSGQYVCSLLKESRTWGLGPFQASSEYDKRDKFTQNGCKV